MNRKKNRKSGAATISKQPRVLVPGAVMQGSKPIGRRGLIVGAGSAAAILGSGAYLLSTGSGPVGGPADDAVLEHALGNPEADVQMIAYVSFTCVHCASFHINVWPHLKRDYVDTGRIGYRLREVAFDQYGFWAAAMARRAGPGRFHRVSDILLEQQSRWIDNEPETTRENLIRIGEHAGLSRAYAERAFTDLDAAENLRGWIDRNVRRDGITSTPSFIINGRRFGNMNHAEFSRAFS